LVPDEVADEPIRNFVRRSVPRRHGGKRRDIKARAADGRVVGDNHVKVGGNKKIVRTYSCVAR
jgi:hypothetical protein